jgi:hypothetical protein
MSGAAAGGELFQIPSKLTNPIYLPTGGPNPSIKAHFQSIKAPKITTYQAFTFLSINSYAFVYKYKPVVYSIFLVAQKVVALDIENNKHTHNIKILRQ